MLYQLGILPDFFTLYFRPPILIKLKSLITITLEKNFIVKNMYLYRILEFNSQFF